MSTFLWGLLGWCAILAVVVAALGYSNKRRHLSEWRRLDDFDDCAGCGQPLPLRRMAVYAHGSWFCGKECVPTAWREL